MAHLKIQKNAHRDYRMNNKVCLKKLGKYVSLRQGLAINAATSHLVSDKCDEQFHLPLLRIADMIDNSYSKFISKDVPKSVKASCDDIIYTRTGQIGLVFTNKTGVVHNNSFIVNIVSDELDKKYLYTVLQSPFVRNQALALAKNSVQPDLTHDMFRSIVIPIPHIDEQIKIANILSCFDKKILMNKAINDNLEKQLRTIYDYWFTQFDFPDENGKPYRSSGGKMVWNEELKREIPEGWNVKKLSEILNVITGKEDANFSSLNGQYKFFTCSNTTLLCDEFAFDGKAVLIAGNGDFNVKHYSGKFNAYQRTYVLLPKEVLFRAPIYLVAKQMINRFVNGSNGSIVKFITKGDIENITILIPYDLQLYKLLNDLLDAIEVNQQEIDQLIKLRNWLLPMLMNGQATVAD